MSWVECLARTLMMLLYLAGIVAAGCLLSDGVQRMWDNMPGWAFSLMVSTAGVLILTTLMWLSEKEHLH